MKIIQLFLLCLLVACKADVDRAAADFDKGVSQTLAADSLLQVGETKEGRHAYNEAINHFEMALAKNKNHVEAATSLAFCHYQLDNYKEASKYYEWALEIQPDLALAKLHLGLSHVSLDEIETGRAFIDAALGIDDSLRPKAVTELIRIGQRAYQYGTASSEEGLQKEEYLQYAIGVLLVAWEYSPENPMVKSLLRGYAEKMGDSRILDLLE